MTFEKIINVYFYKFNGFSKNLHNTITEQTKKISPLFLLPTILLFLTLSLRRLKSTLTRFIFWSIPRVFHIIHKLLKLYFEKHKTQKIYSNFFQLECRRSLRRALFEIWFLYYLKVKILDKKFIEKLIKQHIFGKIRLYSSTLFSSRAIRCIPKLFRYFDLSLVGQ